MIGDDTRRGIIKIVATESDLIAQVAEMAKWLAGGYGPLPAGVTLLIKPSNFETAVLAGLSHVERVARGRAILGEARRVISELRSEHAGETRLINHLTSYTSALSDLLRSLEKRG